METFWQDLRYGARALVKKPGFTFIVVLTLSLGIGANTAIFSFVNALLLRPLPYRDADRLVRIATLRGKEEGRLSMLELRDLREQTSIFESVAPYVPGAQYNYSGDGAPEELAAVLVSRDLFNMLGVQILHGGLWPESYDLERNFGVILTYDLWKRRFGGDPNVLGRKITLDAAPFYFIHGVTPQGFNFPGNVQLFRSIAINDRIPNYKDRDARNVYAVARLKPGVSYEQTRAELNAFSRRMAETYPNINAGLSFTLKPLRDFYAGDIRPYLWLLLAAVGFVLLIACANVINLLLARSLAREREIAIRTALGAGRTRLVRQLLTESLLLAIVGGLVGLATGWGWVKLLRSLVRAELPVWITINIDWRVLAFTLAVSILTGIIAGLAPALQATKPDLNELLKEGAKGSQGSARGQLRKALVVTEIALALFSIVTMEERIADTIWQRRLSGALFIVFATLALILASVGIYGVMSYVVSQRTREIGVRMAMGARPRDVLKLVIGQGAKLIAVGLGAGLIVALIASRIINSLLYQVSATDPLTYLVVSLLLAAVALLACYVPARRAMKVDPMTALRVE